MMKPGELQRHITQTYINLRVGIAIMGFAFPIILWIGGRMFAGDQLQASMSDYYHTRMRDVFVGILIAIGSFLYLYRGFSKGENIALNLAGIFAAGVALLPNAAFDSTVERMDIFSLTPIAPHTHHLHVVCAVSFFLSIAYVCMFRAKDSLRLIDDDTVAARYRRIYTFFGILMVVAPAIVAGLAYFHQQILENKTNVVFFVEAGAVWVFSAYWLVKTCEFSRYPERVEITLIKEGRYPWDCEKESGDQSEP